MLTVRTIKAIKDYTARSLPSGALCSPGRMCCSYAVCFICMSGALAQRMKRKAQTPTCRKAPGMPARLLDGAKGLSVLVGAGCELSHLAQEGGELCEVLDDGVSAGFAERALDALAGLSALGGVERLEFVLRERELGAAFDDADGEQAD